MAIIHKLAKLAHHTFQHINRSDKKGFTDSLNSLVAVANLVKKSDVGLIPEYLSESVWTKNSDEAPVTYIDIFRNDIFTVGIFIIKQGAQIPLHDHPGMYGIIKVLHGRLCVQSYSGKERHVHDENSKQLSGGSETSPSYSEKNAVDVGSGNGIQLSDSETSLMIPVIKNDRIYVSEDDEPGILTPNDSNLHEIMADGGIAAFLDVLAPPYDSARDCHYYKEVSFNNKTDDCKSRDSFLMEIDPPETYWSNSQRYLGPPIRLSHIL
ncbi:hypothetical protein CHUAL_006031 [Chamberlinius hualienensis]